MYNTFHDCTMLFFVSYALQIGGSFRSLMYDIFHQWILDAFKLLYLNSRLISFVSLSSLIR